MSMAVRCSIDRCCLEFADNISLNRDERQTGDNHLMSDVIKPILMPKWGLAMTEGTLVAWHLQEGERVEAGADLCDIETTKITNVFESPSTGILARQLIAPGSVVQVGVIIGVVTDGTVEQATIDAFVNGFQPAIDVDGEGVTDDSVYSSLRLVDGSEIAYQSQGEGDDVVLMIHGYGGDSSNWTYLQPKLATGRRVVALDLPGHGRSAKTLTTDPLGQLVEAVAAVVRELAPVKLHLVGHSLGGAIAILAAPNIQELATLSLIAPCGLGSEINIGFVHGLIASERRKDLEPVLAQLFADPRLVARQMVNDILKYKRIDGVSKVLIALAASAFPNGRQVLDLRPSLAQIDVPKQIIWGLDDQILPVTQSEGLPEDVKMHRLAGAGHMPQVEKAAEVADLLTKFLS